MGENQCLILETPPKKLEYVSKLYNYDKKKTFLEKTKKIILGSDYTRPHTISKWCQILGSTKNNQATRDFLELLVDKQALVKDGVKGSPPNQAELYRLDRNKLTETVYNDVFWDWIRDISIEVINNQEPNKKVVATT